MSRRLYLVDFDRYRVRKLDASIVFCRWDDDAMVFETGRGEERRVIPLEHVAAVSEITTNGKARMTVWYPFDQCFRAKHRPVSKVSTWVHPYARRAS